MAAHRQSGLSALATTPWGGLWTGAAGGSVRLWPHAVSEARTCAAVPAALSQPLGRELRRTSGERAHFRCHGIALAASGQVRRLRCARCLPHRKLKMTHRTACERPIWQTSRHASPRPRDCNEQR